MHGIQLDMYFTVFPVLVGVHTAIRRCCTSIVHVSNIRREKKRAKA